MSKRALGAYEGKPQELGSDMLAKLDALEQEQEAYVLADEFASMYKTIGFYEQRREKLKAIPNFWSIVLQNDQLFASAYGDQRDDLDAIKYLEDIWITRDRPDPRAYGIELYFKPNPYFTNSVIKKSWKLKKAPSGQEIHGVQESMLRFNPDTDLDVEFTKIDWKKDSLNLSKKYPRNDKGDEVELGSFFLFFESPEDELDFGVHLANVLFANPIPYFKGEVDDSEEDEDMDSSEDEDSDAEEIDLERSPKRRKLK